MKTELEEAAEKYNTIILGHGRETIRQAFIEGAKSDAAKHYWFNIFKQNKKNSKLIEQ